MSGEIESKRVRSAAVEIKGGAESGQLRAIVAHTNLIDFGGDVVLPGATKQAEVSLASYNHTGDLGHLPPGKGRIYEQGKHIYLDASFFDTIAGQETRKTIIGLGGLAEYSVEYKAREFAPMTDEWRQQGAKRLIKSWEIYAVSPVLRGMMPDTGTLEIKCDGCCGSSKRSQDDPFANHAKFMATIAPKCDPIPETAKVSLARRLLRFAWARTSPGGTCPQLRWCAPDGKKLGQFDHDRNEILLNTTLEGDDLPLTLFHELRHMSQRRYSQRYDETDAESWAEKTLSRWKENANGF